MRVEARAMREEDRATAMPIGAEAFDWSPAALEQTLEFPVADRWVVTEDDTVRGALRALRVGQFFGGRALSCAAIAAVAIATDARGRGLGQELMRGTLRDLRAEGVALSTLYPASMRPYRAVGYEVAGERLRWSIGLEHVPRKADMQALALGDDDLPAIKDCLRRFGATNNGIMDRPEFWWEPRVLSVEDDQRLYRYGVHDDGGALTGYALFTHHSEAGHLPDMWTPGDEQPYALAMRDLVWTDVASARALLALAAAHASIGTRLLWTAPSADPLLTLFGDRQPVVSTSYRWMARLVDLPAAFEARGWPSGVDVDVALSVEDPDLPDNAGAHRFRLRDGQGSVERVDSADATIDIGALSAIFTGWLDPQTAAELGRMRGADLATIGSLRAAFAGPTPWMLEFF